MRHTLPISKSLTSIHSASFAVKLTLIAAAVIAAVWFYFLFLYTWSFIVVQQHLKSHKWAVSSTIYARPVVLRPGLSWTSDRMREHLDSLYYHRVPSDATLKAGGAYIARGQVISFRKRPLYLEPTPTPVIQVDFGSTGVERITDVDADQELLRYELEPEPILNLVGPEWEKRTLVSLRDIPAHLIHAVTAIEDRRFFKHHGIDIRAIFRALVSNLSNKAISEGGSTITQQVAKNFYLSPERSIRRKMAEFLMAWVLETRLNKEEILELYLNEIYMGQRGSVSIKGVGEASRVYFRKDVQHITVPEAALLAGMIRAPNLYHPQRHLEEALERRNRVLEVMHELNFLTEEEYERHKKAAIKVEPLTSRVNLAPYFGSLVKSQLLEKHSEESLYTSNLHIFTTLDLEMQEQAEKSLAAGLAEIDRKRQHKGAKQKIQGCLIAVEPTTGRIRAMVGGRDYSSSQFNRVTSGFRQPGSVFKPVVYAAALQQAYSKGGKQYTPATLISDEPWILQEAEGNWEPANYDGRFHGSVTMRTALARSFNVATARLAAEIGLDRVVSLANRIGFQNTEPVPSVALGSLEATPWQIATAYSVFANQGLRTDLRTISKITDTSGKAIEQNVPQHERVMEPEIAYLITDMLKSALFYGTGSPIRSFGFYRPAAAKTGTTDEFRDAWLVGYTPRLLCVVWVGYDDNSPIGMTGADAALPIWARFMMKATENDPEEDFPVPHGITRAMVDPETGKIATAMCPEGIPEVFIKGTEPQELCTAHDWGQRASLYDSHRSSGPWRSHFRARAPRKGGFWKKFSRKLRRIF